MSGRDKIENLNTFVGSESWKSFKMQRLPAIDSQELLRFLKSSRITWVLRVPSWLRQD